MIYLYLQRTDFSWPNIPGWLLSLAIRFVTRGEWSHAGIWDGTRAAGDERALVPFLSAQQSGVAYRGHDTNATLLFLKVPHADAILAAMRSQIGKPYDYGAILGILFDRNWRDTGKFFCSELIAWAAEQAQMPLLNPNFALNRVFPNLIGASVMVEPLTAEEIAALPEEIRKWMPEEGEPFPHTGFPVNSANDAKPLREGKCK